MTGRRQQLLRFLDRRPRIVLIAEPLEQNFLWRREIRERVDEPADLHRGHVLDDLDQGRPVEGEMERAPHPRVVERLLLAVDPGALDDALIVRRRFHAWCLRRLARGYRIGDADIVDAARQNRRPKFGRKRHRMEELHLVEIRQPLFQ